MSRYYIILLSSLLGIFSCKSKANESSEESAVPVLPITHPIIKDTLMDQPYVTNIQAIKNVEIRSRVRGILENTFVDEGEVVKKGQVLFKISNDELQIQLDQSKAAVSSAIADASAAEIEQNRVQGLVKKKVVTPSELDLSKERLLALQAKVAEAKAIRDNFAKQLSYTFIKSPFNGVIDRLPLKVGSLVEEGSLFTNISDLTTMFAYFDLPETEYLKLIRANADNKSAIYSDSASLLLTDGSPYPYKGKIQRSESVIDPGTGSIAYRAIFSNPLKILHHNSSGTVILHKEVKNAILIPQKCVFEIQDKNYVFAVNDSNVVHMKSFEPGSRVGKYYIVLSGIDMKDKIVYEGVQNLRDGMKIEIRKN